MSASLDSTLSGVLAGGILLPGLRCTSLDEALRALLAPALDGAGLSAREVAVVLDAVKARESAGSTAIGPLSLPHARVPGLARIIAGLGANADGVYSGAPGTTFVLAFASPAQSAAEHLKFLARAAHLFRDDDARRHLLAAADRDEMLAIVKKTER